MFDLACGTGDLCRDLAAAGYRPVGFDFSFGMLANARTSAPLVQADALRLPVRDGAAAGVTCGFALRNVVSLPTFFEELGRVVRAGRPDRAAGRLAPRTSRCSAPVTASTSSTWCPSSAGCSPTATRTPTCRARWPTCPRPTDLLRMLRVAGFPDVRRLQLTGGLTQLIVGTRS